MSKVSAAKKQHRSMRGKQVDMDLLRKRNELTPAVGNARVNARGDELGPGGQIIKKREDVVAEHYAGTGVAQEATTGSVLNLSMFAQSQLAQPDSVVQTVIFYSVNV